MDSPWLHICRYLQQDLSAQEFVQWIQPLKAKVLDRGHLILQVPTRFHYDWIRERYLPLINSYCQRDNIHVHLRLELPTKKKRSSTAENIPLSSLPVDAYFKTTLNFTTFVVAPFNQFAFAAARAFSGERVLSYNPLFIEASAGLGKTHLLHAIGNTFTGNGRGPAVYLDSRKLLDSSFAENHFNPAILRRALTGVKLLVVDDVHLLPLEGGFQRCLLDIFNDFYNLEKQMVFAASQPPTKIPELMSGLRSRLCWGLIARINNPDVNDWTQVVEGLLRQGGVPYTPQVCRFLVEQDPLNFYFLKDTVERLQGIVENRGRLPDINDVQLLMASKETGMQRLSIQTIQQAVCAVYAVSMDALVGSCKTRTLVNARQVGMYLSRKLIGVPYAAIGASFGGRDHSTVIYACRKVSAEIKRNRDYADRVVHIEKNLSVSCKLENLGKSK